MSPPPRRLSFAVSTSLLSASLSLGAAGCDDKEPTVNPAPEKDSDVRVNMDPVTPEETVHTVNPVPEPTPDPEPDAAREELHVNEGPEPMPEPAPEPMVNTVPDKAPPRPKNVNTRPNNEI